MPSSGKQAPPTVESPKSPAQTPPSVSAPKRSSLTPKKKPPPAPATLETPTPVVTHPVAPSSVSPTKPRTRQPRVTTKGSSALGPEAPKQISKDHLAEAMRASEEGKLTASTASSTRSRKDSMSSLQPKGSMSKMAFAVVDYGATAEKGARKTMEDQHVMLSDGIPFFAVYDGHGGTECAEYLRDHLHGLILGNPEVKTNPEKAILDGILEADKHFVSRTEAENNGSGSVCAVALLLDDQLVVGNVGDTEAVLSRHGKPLLLTVKHTIQSNPSEEERVRALGGKIVHNRVGHPKFNPAYFSLAVTRAIGDAGFKFDEYTDGKPSGVIATPDTKTVKLRDGDEFLVIGCDGLWDVMTYDEVVDFCYSRFREGLTAENIAKELAQAALMKGSTDNVTAMLVHLTRREGPQSTREFYPEAAVSTSTRNLSEEP